MDDSATAALEEAIVTAYEKAAHIAAERHNRALVAAAGQQSITETEWTNLLYPDVHDAFGDSILEGITAAAIALNIIPADAVTAAAADEQTGGMIEWASFLRDLLDLFLQGFAPDSLIDVADILTSPSSPLSRTRARTWARTASNAAMNAGLHAAFEAAGAATEAGVDLPGGGVAALRWVTQRDLRVRDAHVEVDSDTVPLGTPFIVGGYEARYPGDPTLPIGLRINCRCWLAFVDGDGVRRALGLNYRDLYAYARKLGIDGRSKMSKSELQAAVIQALCLHGLAGGPDCPDLLDQMSRNVLLMHARDAGIVGRHAMTRQELLAALTTRLRGNDTMEYALGYATRDQFRAAQRRATSKRRRTPEPTDESRLPPRADRDALKAALFAEFDGDEIGYVPCVHCGLRIHYNPISGLAALVPEPIIPWSEGGRVSVANALPTCPACFKVRGGRGLVAAAGSISSHDEIVGEEVTALAVGWDARFDDDWTLYAGDLPTPTSIAGTIITRRVDDLGYSQWIVGGIPVDPETVHLVNKPGQKILVNKPGQKILIEPRR